jgi:hypothetical protein
MRGILSLSTTFILKTAIEQEKRRNGEDQVIENKYLPAIWKIRITITFSVSLRHRHQTFIMHCNLVICLPPFLRSSCSTQFSRFIRGDVLEKIAPEFLAKWASRGIAPSGVLVFQVENWLAWAQVADIPPSCMQRHHAAIHADGRFPS